MDELFDALGAISDQFLEEEKMEIEARVDLFLDSLTEDDLSETDLMWWVAAFLALVEPTIAALPLDRRAREIQSVYGRAPSASFGPVIQERLRGVAELEAARLHSRVMDARVGGALGEDFLDAFRGAVTRAVENVINEADTSMSMFDRLAFDEAGKRQPGTRRWAYDGPRDNRNRPFCAAVLDERRTYSEREVQALNRHPLLHRYVPPNVKTLCGGFGCRHIFISLSKEEAEKRGLSWV